MVRFLNFIHLKGGMMNCKFIEAVSGLTRSMEKRVSKINELYGGNFNVRVGGTKISAGPGKKEKIIFFVKIPQAREISAELPEEVRGRMETIKKTVIPVLDSLIDVRA